MALRSVEITIPSAKSELVQKLIAEKEPISTWESDADDGKKIIKVLMKSERTESILDDLEKRLSVIDDYRIVLTTVEATLPRIPVDDDEKKPEESEEKAPLRVNREELYNQIQDGAKLNSIFITMVILSAIVASIGLLDNNVAVIIAAMVIAPLLGPNVALALSTTLADFELGKLALKTNLTGVLVALLFSISIGLIFTIDPTSPEIFSRTSVGLMDIVLALASGAAAALAFASGTSASLIGVMVAVALLPPLVTLGILLGSGYFVQAFGAFLLLVTNLISVNLAGVITFIAQGIRPRNWWEAKKAKRTTRWSIIIWTVLLILLIITILISQGNY
ncbi:Uncharacterized protein, MJ0678-like [hydrothermal vent metagenome]|uniref:Uncharacterized protein, MJ0678-like n=1 Tax=hydrothermal vent metagenome TaxID=652676 RepID=A0A3B1CFX0_9ZZZZ